MMKKTKIACLVSHPIQYQTPLFKKISEDENFDLTVLYLSDRSLKKYYDDEFQEKIKWDINLLNGYNYKFLPTIGKIDKPNFLFPLCIKIKKILKEGDYEILWIHGWGHLTNIIAINIANKLGIKVMLRGESYSVKNDVFLKKILKKLLMEWLKNKVHFFLAIGTLNNKYYLSYGIPPKNIVNMPYAVDNNYFSKKYLEEKSKFNQHRSEYNIKSNDIVFLYLSKFTERKRSNHLLDAFFKIQQANFETKSHLILIGNGELKDKLTEFISKNNIQNVHLLPFKNQSEISKFYSMSDVFVLPSIEEPWGLVVNEAMVHGCFIICSNEVGCSVDLVENGENGLIYDAKDNDGLLEALKKCILDSKMVHDGHKKSLEKIKNWDYESNIKGLYQVKSLINKIY